MYTSMRPCDRLTGAPRSHMPTHVHHPGKQLASQFKQAIRPWITHKARVAAETKAIAKANQGLPKEMHFPLTITNPVESERCVLS